MLHHPTATDHPGRHRPPRTWRHASRATSAVLLVGATAWGVHLGVAAPNSSPVTPPAAVAGPAPAAGGTTGTADATDTTDDRPARGGRGGGRGGRG